MTLLTYIAQETHIKVLSCLHRLERPAHLRELARLLKLSPRGASLILASLEEHKLIKCRICKGDRKKFFELSLSKEELPFLIKIAEKEEENFIKQRSKQYNATKALSWIDPTIEAINNAKLSIRTT